MPSLQHQLIKLSANNLGRAVNKNITQVQSLRRLLDMSAVPLSLPKNVKAVTEQIGNMAVEWYEPRNADSSRVILFVHGGGYAVGSIQTHRALAARLAECTNCLCLNIDYRLAPEHAFPAGLEDVVHAYEWLILKGFNPGNISFVGDSAGGGLIMATLLTLRKLQSPMPAGVALMSPWVDLTFSQDSAKNNQEFDPIVTVEDVKDWAVIYAGKYSLRHPMISPVFGNLADLPPILIQVSDKEVLTDDSVMLHQGIQRAGGKSTLRKYEGLLHVWQLFWKYVPEAQEAIDEMADFLIDAFEQQISRHSNEQIRKAS